MKPGKATGPELWKSRHWNSTEWLTAFFNQIIAEKKTPVDWQESTTIPIWKRKGNPADCSNCRPIRLFSHSMKIFERVIDRDIIRVTTNQCVFVANYGYNPYGSARQKQKPLHLMFLDLEEAFGLVPHDVTAFLRSSSSGLGFSTRIQVVECRLPRACQQNFPSPYVYIGDQSSHRSSSSSSICKVVLRYQENGKKDGRSNGAWTHCMLI